MPEYQWAEKNGNIVVEDYDRRDTLDGTQVMAELKSAFEVFGRRVSIQPVDQNNSDVYIVSMPEGEDVNRVYVCAKGTTPGGRDNLKDEQRIQPKSKYFNFVFEKMNSGEKAISLGIYTRDGEVVFCAWKVQQSNAATPDTPISKQIKIQSIAKAMTEGFVQQDKGRGEYACAFRKEFLYFYLRNSDWLHTGHVSELSEHTLPEAATTDQEMNTINFNTGFISTFERNRIIFGAPGTGKSYKLKIDSNGLLNGTSGTYERVTFHPDYSYAHFVGTYKPITDPTTSEIKYEFVPGPFIRIYVDAIRSGKSTVPQPHLLLIEEINRAKVAAVFGDIFQLLDRDDMGVSEYEIHTNEDVKKYLVKELGGNTSDYTSIRIPDNLFIWATMNSADQGVFPVDTAFKRRWNFEYIGINENESLVKAQIELGEGRHSLVVEWNKLRRAINEKLAIEYKINEDKLLGPYFISKTTTKTINEVDGMMSDPIKFVEAFKNKVIMYLYEDAGKQYKHKLFDGCSGENGFTTSKYSSVCDAFDKLGIDIFGPNFRELYNSQGE